ncbi:MAG TPA: hypothetical protein VNY29_13635 [Terriglobales bacterium]|nr:hypothetical protein [Terriglobales bacterium]
MDSATRQFRLPPSALPAAERRIRNTLLIPQMSLVVIGVLLSLFLFVRNANLRTTLAVAGFDAVFFTYIAFVSPRRMHDRLVKLWNSYVLEVGPDYLLRRQADTPEVRLSFAAIKNVEYRPGHSLRVIGTAKRQMIGIPESIEHLDEVFQTVTALAPVTRTTSNRAFRTNALLALGFGAYLVMLWAASPWVVVPLATGISGLILCFVVFMQRSPNVTLHAKRTGWLYLIFVLTCGAKVLAVIGPLLRH